MSISSKTEILTPTQMIRADGCCDTVESAIVERSGLAVAEEILRRYGARATVFLCGSGRAGKIGCVAARHLSSWGWPIEISNKGYNGQGLIVDALHTNSIADQISIQLADQVNASGVPIISIDLPAGIEDLTGLAPSAYIQADVCMAFFRKKPAHVLFPGRAYCGEIIVLNNGISDSVLDLIAPELWENSKPKLPALSPLGHKYNRGHAVVLSGGQLQTGASRLAAQAALKIGAGVVTLVGDADALGVQANHVTAIMLKVASNGEALASFMSDPHNMAVCIGPAAGVDEATQDYIRSALACGKAVVLDADALTTCSKNLTELSEWIRFLPSRPVVMTPHEGEFQRHFGGTDIGRDSKIDRARIAARISGAIIVLKGADTVIAHPDGRAVVNTNAPPSLATAGSGDVLAGIIVGLLAQGIVAFEAACAGVWLHAECTHAFGNRGFTSEDLVNEIGQRL